MIFRTAVLIAVFAFLATVGCGGENGGSADGKSTQTITLQS